MTDFYPPTGRYTYRPQKCTLHQRDGWPIAGANLRFFHRLHWRAWRPGKARAKGKLAINAYGLATVRVKLRRPRRRCGETVFTEVAYRGKVRYEGDTDHFRDHMRLTDCLH